MRVLMITPYLPFPLLSGGQTRTYNLLKKLAPQHQITLFSFIRKNEEKKYIPELEKLGVSVQVFKRRPAWQFFNILLAGFSWFPFLVAIYLSRGLQKKIEEELKEGNYDVVHAEPFYVVPNIPHTKVPLLLVDQTIEFQVYQHFVEKFKYWILKPLLYFDVWKMRFWESRYWQQANRVVAMSDEDKRIIKKEAPGTDVDVVPNGVDADYFDPEKVKDIAIKRDNKKPVVLYVGNCTWLQNREAIEILYKDVWPKITEKLPEAKLWIIGKSADHFFSHLRSEKVRVEEVKDIREAYFGASVLVAPIYGAGGTRYKFFEAFASELPIITTSIGIGGTDATDGENVIIRNTPATIAEATIDILQNEKLYQKIAKNGKKLIREKYDWEAISQKLGEIYEELGKSHR